MNPHFQPQPQTHPSHPQNPHYPTAQTHPGHNNYPPQTLPPHQNPPQYYYPPQQYAQQPQYHPQTPPPGYIPPAYYGNIQAMPAQNVNSESFKNAASMREVERGLEGGHIKCYTFWLWVVILSSSISVFNNLVAYRDDHSSSSTKTVKLGLVAYYAWSVTQSVIGLLAYHQKSLAKATVAVLMMIIYMIPALIFEVQLIMVMVAYQPSEKDAFSTLVFILVAFPLIWNSVNLLVHLAVDITGAIKVRNVLVERNLLQEKIKESEEASINQP